MMRQTSKSLIKQKFRQKIREHKYEFVFASNGRHALELLTAHADVDMVLSDINMPEMDGLTLLSDWPKKITCSNRSSYPHTGIWKISAPP